MLLFRYLHNICLFGCLPDLSLREEEKKRTDNERLKNLRIQNSQTGYDELDTY